MPYGTNILSAADSGFESGLGNWSAQSNCTAATSTTHAHSGTTAAEVTTTAVAQGGIVSGSNLGGNVTPGFTYDFYCWMWPDAGSLTGSLAVDFRTAAYVYVSSAPNSLTFNLTNGAWNLLVYRFTVPLAGSITQTTLNINTFPASTANHFWIDDVLLARTPTPPLNTNQAQPRAAAY